MHNGKIVQTNPEVKSLSASAFRFCHRETDITLMCKDNELLKAHKLILASSSKVFEDLILNQNGPGHVIKLEISLQNVELFLELLYTGECKLNLNCLPHLQKVVEGLQVKGIYINGKKLKSEQNLYNTVVPWNTRSKEDIQSN